MPNIALKSDADFSYLNEPSVQHLYALEGQQNVMRFHIDGIQCAKCIRKLETLPETLPGLTHLRIDSGANLAYAEIDQRLLSFSQLATKLNSMGFKPTPLLSDSEKTIAGHRANRTELIRLAIAAACAGNIMMFSFANYLGSTGIFRSVFSWLSFALYLPVVTYVAWPFYTGALSSLRQKQVSIDLPMAIASLAGFFYSTFELFNDRENFYFDSLSGFLFLILISRWMQGRLQKTFLTRESNENLGLEKMRKLSGDDWCWVPAGLLQPGDKIRVLRDETVPVDGTVISPRIRISLAWLSGESKSVSLTKNSTIKAGARIISESADIHVQRLTQHTEFGQLLDAAERFSLSNNRFISMSDKWSERLLIAVFAIAALYLTFNVSNDMEESFRRALALIVIACPCAMAFGTPLALSSALRKARKNGLLVRDANVFEKCANVRTLFFDKTGTLTESEISLVEDPESYSDELKSVILTLEAPSQHPIAYAFRQAFTKSKILSDVTEWSEKPGEGISARIGQDLYEIKKCIQTTTACALFKNGELTAEFTFSAQLRIDALNVLEKLRKTGYHTILLSGDSEEATLSIGHKLGFQNKDIYFLMSPTQKAHLVKKCPNSMMIGDGINDSLALMRAEVSVATTGAVDAALKSAAVYVTNSQLAPITALFDISREAIFGIRTNLLVAVIYNTVTGSLALAGFINPLVAALLMPVSSGIILASTWLRSRR